MIARRCPVCFERLEGSEADDEFGTEVIDCLKYDREMVYYCGHCCQYFFEEDFFFTET